MRTDWFELPAVQETQESSPTQQFESINYLMLSFLYGPTVTSIHNYWKNHSFGHEQAQQGPLHPGIERDMCTPMFIATLFIIDRTWKQPRCPSADEWIRKLWYIYTMEYYSAIKMNTFESVLMR